MDQRSVFFEEWLRSLREHYKHVVRINDEVTLPTLSAVMQNVGFSEDELAQLRVEATMHVDDVGADFVLDPDILKGSSTIRAHPRDCPCPQDVSGDERLVAAESLAVPQGSETTTHESGRAYPAVGMDYDDNSDETQPLTFEDSLNAEVDDTEEVPAESEDTSDADDDLTDGPEQMSLF